VMIQTKSGHQIVFDRQERQEKISSRQEREPDLTFDVKNKSS